MCVQCRGEMSKRGGCGLPIWDIRHGLPLLYSNSLFCGICMVPGMSLSKSIILITQKAYSVLGIACLIVLSQTEITSKFMSMTVFSSVYLNKSFPQMNSNCQGETVRESWCEGFSLAAVSHHQCVFVPKACEKHNKKRTYGVHMKKCILGPSFSLQIHHYCEVTFWERSPSKWTVLEDQYNTDLYRVKSNKYIARSRTSVRPVKLTFLYIKKVWKLLVRLSWTQH